MKKLLLLALAPLAMLATPANAQTTMQRTVSPNGTVTTTTTTRHVAPAVVRRTVVRRHRQVTYGHRPRVTRSCRTIIRHHHRERVCRTVRRR